MLLWGAAAMATIPAACRRPAPATSADAAAAIAAVTDRGTTSAADGAVEAAVLIAAQATAPGAVPLTPKSTIRHVIIISEDGLRPDALMDVRPPVHDAIMKKGAYSLEARTIRHASTLPSHAAMLSGFDMGEHGLSWNSWQPQRGYIHVPTIFDAACRAGGKAAAFVGKRKLEHIAHPGSVDVFSRPGLFCKSVVKEAARYFVEQKPEVEFVHFSDPDERGHAVGWMSDPQM
jgi:Type I phosphodiesterase / nucleotide pyrophosphatase